MKIVVTQFWTSNLSYTKYTKEINHKYCEEKGYIYHVEEHDNKIRDRLGNRSLTWYKPLLLLDVLEEHNPDYVLFLDADAIIVNNSYNIEEFVSEDKDIIVTEDYGPSEMNAGVILIKNTEWVKWFLQKWYDICDELYGGESQIKGYYKTGLWHDQTCFSFLLMNDININKKIKVIDNKILNGRYFKDTINKNFIFHAFSYGQQRNRTLDTSYYSIFNIPIPESDDLLDMVQYYSTDKHTVHNFFNLIYNDLFKTLKSECKIFMEIGVYDCESIKLWRDYFINAEIVGIENNLSYSLEKLGDTSKDRITFINADQSKEDDLFNLSQKYSDIDVILDDGSHKMKDQQITFAKLFKSLKSGGIFIIEDLHTSFEVVMPEKSWCQWGDPNKTITLNMLNEFKKTGKIYSDFMTEEEMDYLNKNIQSIEIYQSRPDWSVTSVIKKK